ncbi:MAG: DUF2336 domain-containing protein [Rhodoplanes sp.]
MSASLVPGVDSLLGLAQRGLDMKPTLLRVLTELYVQKTTHSSEEERQFVELALRLVDAVDAETRAAVARRLSGYPGAPDEILRRVAENPHLAGVADGVPRRAQTPNPAARYADPDSASRFDPASAADAANTERFFAATPEQRALLLAELDAAGAIEPAAELTPTRHTAAVLEASALAGRPSDFVRELERALRIAQRFAEAIVNDPSGEPLVVAAKALAIPIDVLQRILLFVNPAIGHSVRRVYALTALFDRISLAAALRLVESWRRAGGVAPVRPRANGASQSARAAIGAGAVDPARHSQAAHPLGPAGPPSANDPVEKVAS